MILSRLLYYKSDEPVSYLPRRKAPGPAFHQMAMNSLVDENFAQVLREGVGRKAIPAGLHPITRESLPERERQVADALIRHGRKAYLAGGAVRDLICGETVSDFDFSTDAGNDELRRIFPQMQFHSIPTGYEFGYLTFGDETIDVDAMLNIPAAYHGLSKVPGFDPAALYSRDIVCDAMERDLTINAIYFDVGTGELIDPLGGLHDLREGVISVPLRDHAAVVLRNDPRIVLRAIRFAACFGFELESGLDRAIRELGGELVPKIPPDLLYLVLPSIFSGGYAGDGVRLLMEYSLMRLLFPALGDIADAEGYREYAVKTCRAVDWIFDEGTKGLPLLAMAALLWPAVSRLERQGCGDPAGEVLRLQRGVMALGEEEAAFLYHALQISRASGREEIRERVQAVFGDSRFEDALGMLQIHYWTWPEDAF